MRLKRCIAALRMALPFLESAAEEQATYGFFCGGDPRDFKPDEQSCTPEELEAHRKACEAFTADRPLPGSCEHVFEEQGKLQMILTKAPFGIGIQTHRDSQAVQAYEAARAALEIPES